MNGGNPLPDNGGGNAVLCGGKLGRRSGGGAGKEALAGGGNPKLATGGGILELNTPGTGGGGIFDFSEDELEDLGKVDFVTGFGKFGTLFTGGGNSGVLSKATPFLIGG